MPDLGGLSERLIAKYGRAVFESQQETLRQVRQAHGLADNERKPRPFGWVGRVGDKRQEPEQTQQQAPDAEQTIKIYGSLAIAARARKQDSALRVWHVGRHIDAAGEGIVEVADVRKLARAWLGLTRRQLRRLLVNGDGVLWQRVRDRRGRDVLRLASLQCVAVALGAEFVSTPVKVPASVLGKLKTWRAACWAAWLEGRPGRHGPMTRAKQAAVSGLPERTQREYEQAGGVVSVQRNIAVSTMPYSPELVNYLRCDGGRPGAFRVGHNIGWTLPNSYSTEYERAKRGMTKRVNKVLSDGLLNYGDTGSRRQRLFWGDANNAESAIKRMAKDTPGQPSGDAMPGELYARRIAGREFNSRAGAAAWAVIQ